MVKNIFFEEICDGAFCEAAGSFKDEARGALVVLNCVSLLISDISVLCCFIKQMKKSKPCITL